MAWRPHGRAQVDRHNPRAWAVCDDCGFLYNRDQLRWQFEWFGARTQNTNFLKCEKCLDELQEQRRVIVLPSDPVPILNPRPEQYTTDNNPVSSIGTPFGTMTQAAGLAAAFDSNTNKPMFLSAAQFISVNGANTVGLNWTGVTPNNQGISAQQMIATAPNNARFFGGGTASWSFQGSNTPLVGFNIIGSGTTAGTLGEVINIQINSPVPYLYHQFVLTGDGINSVAVAQLQIYSASSP